MNKANPIQVYAITLQKQIWKWAEKRTCILQLPNIPGHKNINADRESRVLSCVLEWMLCPKSLHRTLKILKFNPVADKQYKLPVWYLFNIQGRSQS